MTEHELFQKTFSTLHASPDTLMEVQKAMENNKKTHRTLRRGVVIAIAAMLIDHIGGIDITLTAAEAQYYSNKHSVLFGNNLSAGSIHMNGDQALAHLRNRTLGTDFERTRRQRDVMIAMLNQVLGQSLTQMDSTLDFVLDIIRTNIKATDFLSVGLSIVTNFSSGVKSMSVPNRSQQGKEYRFASYKGMSILKLLDPNDPTKQMDLTYTERKVREFLYD